MQYFRRLISRLLAWQAARNATPIVVVVPDFVAYAPNIARDVSRHGVRFYSLCETCGDRMESSATLCDACAQKRSGFSSGY